MSGALCAGMETDIFFHDGTTSVIMPRTAKQRAKVICAACPVQRECLQFAIDSPEPDGIWGGTTPQERGMLIRRDRRLAKAEARKRWGLGD